MPLLYCEPRQVAGHNNIFAVGDAATLPKPEQRLAYYTAFQATVRPLATGTSESLRCLLVFPRLGACAGGAGVVSIIAMTGTRARCVVVLVPVCRPLPRTSRQ